MTVEFDGEVGELVAAGGVIAHGRNSDAIHTGDQGLALDHLIVRADHGQAIVPHRLTDWPRHEKMAPWRHST